MFEYAISQHQKRRPTRRFLLSWVASCTVHLAALLILIAHPELLLPGLNRWLHEPIQIRPDDKQWRTLTFVGKGSLQQPSKETLQKYTYDWDAAGKAKIPPIRLRWGDESNQPDQKAENKPPTPIQPVPGRQEPKPAPETASNADTASAVPGSPAGVPGGDEGAGAGRAGLYYLPAPSEAKPPEPPKAADAGTAPRAIPNKIQPPPPPPPPPAPNPATAQNQTPAPQVFENEQKALHTEGSGFFNTSGFPLGEYANIIIERIKGNWYIPSNLKSSQGRTTVIFFIGKDGRYTNAHIVTSSGSTSLDLAALNAVLVSNPFPPLPNGFPGEQVGAKFVFSYNERH
jgi:TonB family protein